MKRKSPETVGIGRACPNIAFVKYWGKRDAELNIPMVDSLSVTLDGLETIVEVSEAQNDSIFWRNGASTERLSPALGVPYLRVLDRFRGIAQTSQSFSVLFSPSLPPGQGFAGSAAAFAGFARAMDDALRLGLDRETLSIMARIGSGSAARSIPGGFVRWHAGERKDGADSVARTVFGASHWPELRLVLVETGRGMKKVPSTEGMIRSAATSRLYPRWLETCERDIEVAIGRIEQRDIEGLGRIIESNAAEMHAVALSSSPPILYMNELTVELIEQICGLRERGVFAYCTLDAGPNPIIVTTDIFLQSVLEVIEKAELVHHVVSVGG
mgnify:CR=1 FL=1